VVPYGYGAKAACIEKGVGLFKLNEFMGAINTQGEDYLNYLLRPDRESRLDQLWRIVEACSLQSKATVYAFGSYLRRLLHDDVDLVLVYSPTNHAEEVAVMEQTLANAVRAQSLIPDVTVASEAEFRELRGQLQHDNLTKVEPRSGKR
jgi:predicted nucleotidyltransferase